MPFKATAGLHHPVRSLRGLTYEPSPPCARMHGFLNLFVAAALARSRLLDEDGLREVLEDESPRSFVFGGEGLSWRDHHVGQADIQSARRFARSFGSCSFEEPVADLQALQLIP